MKEFFKKLLPPQLVSTYHLILAFLAAFWYRFPSQSLIVIGVTGTKGKTTTSNLIAQILQRSGRNCGLASTVNFRIGEREWVNETKQTMLGRFQLQKLLSQMVKSGCEYAVVETSSEGILQHRHRFIDYDLAVFTNLTPEHIERHGGFKNYRQEKIKLFGKVAKKKEGKGVYNLDDENVAFFLRPPMALKYGYALKSDRPLGLEKGLAELVVVEKTSLSRRGTEFMIRGVGFKTRLVGLFNVYNAAAAISAALALGLNLLEISEALALADPAPGRMEEIRAGQDFVIIVDYSYEPKSLENALETVKLFEPRKTIVVFGSAAGGRDSWRRPVMGEIASQKADIVVVTTDDPYDENPEKIVDEVLAGVLKDKIRVLGENVFKIVDRKEAIEKAFRLAQKNDLVLLAGKGGEVWMNVAGGKKIPWQENKIALRLLKKILSETLKQ